MLNFCYRKPFYFSCFCFSLYASIALGADVNAVNSQTFTAIHIAASEGHKQVLECMLQYGAKPNITGGPKLRTPIHVAVEENRVSFILCQQVTEFYKHFIIFVDLFFFK